MFQPGRHCKPVDEASQKSYTGAPWFHSFFGFARAQPPLNLSTLSSDESYLESVYSNGIQVARTHRMIAELIFRHPFGENFEKFWTASKISYRRWIIYNCLDNALRPNRGFTKRLLCVRFQLFGMQKKSVSNTPR
jgi:hypothetical protein